MYQIIQSGLFFIYLFFSFRLRNFSLEINLRTMPNELSSMLEQNEIYDRTLEPQSIRNFYEKIPSNLLPQKNNLRISGALCIRVQTK